MSTIRPTPFEQFRESLYRENLRGYLELESLRYGIMARLGLSEGDALELTCKLVAGPDPRHNNQPINPKGAL